MGLECLWGRRRSEKMFVTINEGAFPRVQHPRYTIYDTRRILIEKYPEVQAVLRKVLHDGVPP